MTAAEFRAMALRIPQALESSHGGHPDFRIAGKVFASLGAPDENFGMVKLTPAGQAGFSAKAPAVFSPCAGVWGRRGYTNVHLPSAETGVLEAAIQAAGRPEKPAR